MMRKDISANLYKTFFLLVISLLYDFTCTADPSPICRPVFYAWLNVTSWSEYCLRSSPLDLQYL